MKQAITLTSLFSLALLSSANAHAKGARAPAKNPVSQKALTKKKVARASSAQRKATKPSTTLRSTSQLRVSQADSFGERKFMATAQSIGGAITEFRRLGSERRQQLFGRDNQDGIMITGVGRASGGLFAKNYLQVEIGYKHPILVGPDGKLYAPTKEGKYGYGARLLDTFDTKALQGGFQLDAKVKAGLEAAALKFSNPKSATTITIYATSEPVFEGGKKGKGNG